MTFLTLTQNYLTGSIPPSIGNLDNIYWLDLADNMLSGGLPVSVGTTPGLDLLTNAKHFHLNKNRFSGALPSKIFNPNMKLIHLLLDDNQLTGSIPAEIVNVSTLQIIRLDKNLLTGLVPSNLNNSTTIEELHLSNNQLTGALPNLTGMNRLQYVDLSNNSFDTSDIPSWLTTLASLTTLVMENVKIQGQLPEKFLSLQQLQKVQLSNNRINGTLTIGNSYSEALRVIDLQNNSIEGFTVGTNYQYDLLLAGNPVCKASQIPAKYCGNFQSPVAYSTKRSCEVPTCSQNMTASPYCKCAYAFNGWLIFRAPSFSDLTNETRFHGLEGSLQSQFQGLGVSIDSISLSDMHFDGNNYLNVTLDVYPGTGNHFSSSNVAQISRLFSSDSYKDPPSFGPYYFVSTKYPSFQDDVSSTPSSSSLSTAAIIGIAVGGVIFALLLLLGLLFVIKKIRKKPPMHAASRRSSASKESSDIFASGVLLKFTYDELRKITNNFSDDNDIGSGGYGKVYWGMLPTKKMVAVKRLQEGSTQGSEEFRAEVEMLSRVHHKNLVTLVGLCSERGENILVYEYIANGTLRDSLSGESGIRLSWNKRLHVAVGAARGISYLHEHADPPIIHRDIKSTNILLDEKLNAKVSDFGLSKLMNPKNKGHVSTQVKGTMGYLDPEYYMTQQLTDKSDVYSFGVVMLELITGRRPLENGKYIVKEVRSSINRTKELYNLSAFLDPILDTGDMLVGFDKFVDLALTCVEEFGVDRPPMGEVCRELENISHAVNTSTSRSPATSGTQSYGWTGGARAHPYDDGALHSSIQFSPFSTALPK